MDYCLEPHRDGREPLCFSWDARTGTVTGPGAEYIREMATVGSIPVHPVPCSHRLSSEPLKSWEDMAAIFAFDYHLTPDLAEHYPRHWDPDDFDPKVTY